MRPILTVLTSCFIASVSHAQPCGATSAEVTGESGLSRVILRVAEGMIWVNFPDDMAAGDRVIASVYQEPTGNDQKERERNAAILARYGFILEGQTSRSKNRLRWQIPARNAGGALVIEVRDRANRLVAKCDLPVATAPADAPGFAETPRLDLPTEGRAGGFVTVWGSLPAELETSVMIGGKEANLSAQGPRKAVFLTSPEVVGQTNIAVKAGPISANGPFYSLLISLTTNKNPLHKGDTAELTVTVSGLTDLVQPALLTLANLTPSVAAMSGGNLQRISITPADVRSDGTFRLARTVVAEQDGIYHIDGVVTRSPTSRLPLEALAGGIIDRWSRRNSVAVAPNARALIIAGIAAARSRLDEFFAPQMALLADPGSLLNAVVSEYCFELRDDAIRATRRVAQTSAPRDLRIAAFAPQDPGRGAVVAIDRATVSAHPFLEFLGRWLARLAPESPTSTLTVSCVPDQRQQITIDRLSGSDFFTPQIFTVNVGTHSVVVMSCRKTVQVLPNLPAKVDCVLQ